MFAIAKIIGTGKEDDAYRPDISGSDYSAIIPSNPDGSPKFNWCLARLENYDVAVGAELFKLPKLNLDFTVRDISPAIRIAMQTKLNSLNVDISKLTLDTKMREVIKWIGEKLDINFKSLGDTF